MKKVVIYGAASADIHNVYLENAYKLGEKLAKKGIACITGAGKTGMMGAINDSVLSNNGIAVGIIPKFMVSKGWIHPHLMHTFETETMHERKQLMALWADAVIALPGGVGTLEELMEIITWKQLGLYHNPILIYNINDFYTPLVEFLNSLVDKKFLCLDYPIWQVVDNDDILMDILGIIHTENTEL